MTKVGIMQPYFFPYLGYWQLLNTVDTYVVYDDVNFIKGGWVNRNRISIEGTPHYFTLRLSGASPNKYIKDISVADDSVYIDKMIRTLEQSYRKAPCFDDIMPLLIKILRNPQRNLALFLYDHIKDITEYIGIKTNLVMSSSLTKDNSLSGEERVIDICKRLGADEYYNAIGGRKLYSKENFEQNHLALKFVKTKKIIYKQFNNDFIENLSIIDVLMFNSKKTINELLKEFDIL